MPILSRIGEAGGDLGCNEERMNPLSSLSHVTLFGRRCRCGGVWRARRAGFGFAETVVFGSILCFLFVSRCSVYHSEENEP